MWRDKEGRNKSEHNKEVVKVNEQTEKEPESQENGWAITYVIIKHNKNIYQ